MGTEVSKFQQVLRSSINSVKLYFEKDRLSPEEHGESGGAPMEPAHALAFFAANIQTLDLPSYYNKRQDWYPLARRVARIKSQGKFAKGLSIGTVVHFDAGRGNPLSTMESGRANNYLYSAIGRDGQFYQSNSLSEWGWHAGKSEWKIDGKARTGVSAYFDGVEVSASGLLKKMNGDLFAPWYATKQSDYIHKREVRFVQKNANVLMDGYYHAYTAAQEAALIQYLLWRKVNDPKNYSFDNVVGHDEVATPLGRKNDPGGALSMYMPAFREKLKTLYAALKLEQS